MKIASLKKHSSQLLVAMAASMGYMTIGLVRGWSSPGLPSMMDLNPELIPSEEVVSWVSAVPPMGAMCGSLAVAPALQRLGRKRSLMLAAPLFVTGWTLIAFATSSAMLIAGRILCGFCAGLVTPSAQVYVSESAHAKTRGILGSLPALFMAGGVLISYVLGTWLSWKHLALASAAFPALLFVALLPLPESPAWLLSHGRVDEAKEALRWLQRTADVAAIELNVMQAKDGGVAPAKPPADPAGRRPRRRRARPRAPPVRAVRARAARPAAVRRGGDGAARRRGDSGHRARRAAPLHHHEEAHRGRPRLQVFPASARAVSVLPLPGAAGLPAGQRHRYGHLLHRRDLHGDRELHQRLPGHYPHRHRAAGVHDAVAAGDRPGGPSAAAAGVRRHHVAGHGPGGHVLLPAGPRARGRAGPAAGGLAAALHGGLLPGLRQHPVPADGRAAARAAAQRAQFARRLLQPGHHVPGHQDVPAAAPRHGHRRHLLAVLGAVPGLVLLRGAAVARDQGQDAGRDRELLRGQAPARQGQAEGQDGRRQQGRPDQGVGQDSRGALALSGFKRFLLVLSTFTRGLDSNQKRQVQIPTGFLSWCGNRQSRLELRRAGRCSYTVATRVICAIWEEYIHGRTL